ncbi:hypothetical protein NDU88_009983 [Pleurodeles waltl]|uniref:Uncharacterized protein n=1 Tax=Pleurodeles waltl TaxID=8319 RepID=A0AAV7RZA3_PLEWA|nr:hypothetical protein NDU88_009983 [Pleurodeles waltl]
MECDDKEDLKNSLIAKVDIKKTSAITESDWRSVTATDSVVQDVIYYLFAMVFFIKTASAPLDINYNHIVTSEGMRINILRL